MSVTGNIEVALRFLESVSNDLGVAQQPHALVYPGTIRAGDYTSGTADNQQDLVWSDRRTLTAASEQLDLRGILTAAIGGAAMNMVEVRGIAIVNRATVAASVLLVGGGANPAFAGLFGATGNIIKVPASGCIVWIAPLDGGGLSTTGGTADMLTMDSVAATITYDVLIWAVSA